jgi:hypothetical protein
MKWLAAMAIAGGVLFNARASTPAPIDFDKVPRTIPKAPAFTAEKPLYGLFLFGKQGQARVWAVLDKSQRQSPVYDVLFLDRNANGDLTEPGERFTAKKDLGDSGGEAYCRFQIGDFKDPGTGDLHTEFRITWWQNRVGFFMKWRGDKPTLGSYGPTPATYGVFASSLEHAPILVPGHDQPFQFLHWMSDVLKRGQPNDFKVFIGNPGSGTGAFSCVDDDFLPRDGRHYVVATLIYKNAAGQSREARYELKDRC